MQPFSYATHPLENLPVPDGIPWQDCLPGFGLGLRLAQRALAPLIDAAVRGEAGNLRLANLRRSARRTLSALSADDHSRLARWLSLQLASTPVIGTEAARMLASVGPALAAHVDALLAGTREELSAGRGGIAA